MASLRNQLNVNPLAPFIIITQQAARGYIHRVRGPGVDERIPFFSYESAERFIKRRQLIASLPAEVQEYAKLLAAHDWHYPRADDYSVYSKGKRERDELRRLSKTLDPYSKIWNQFAPAEYQIRCAIAA